MERVIETAGVHAEIISPEDGHYFFGYYDLQPFDSTGRYHLCHRAPFEDRIPGEHDICEIGMLDITTRKFIKLAKTTAWNFQQGALLQWFRDDDHIIYNVREAGKYCSCVMNIKTGEKRILPMAIANLSKDGKKAVCINFSRIFDFRPGYGYCGIQDPYFDEKAPAEDGIYIMDTDTGACRLVVNYEAMRAAFPKHPYSDEKLLVNHITFNPSADRFVFLLRNFPENGGKWVTLLLTCDEEGNLRKMADYAVHSHYHWKNDRELLIVSTHTSENRVLGLYTFHDETGEVSLRPEPNPERPLKDIHCLYSPDQRFIMGDGYPDQDSFRWLHFIDTKTNQDTVLGKYFSYYAGREDLEYRCDLHARYDRTGRYVSFDSNHIGNRCVCRIDLKDLEGYWEEAQTFCRR